MMTTRRLELRLRTDDFDRMRDHARRRGIPLAVLARAALLDTPLPDRKTGIEAEAVAALNRVGSVLNQLAAAGNAGALTPKQVAYLGNVAQQARATVETIRGQAHV